LAEAEEHIYTGEGGHGDDTRRKRKVRKQFQKSVHRASVIKIMMGAEKEAWGGQGGVVEALLCWASALVMAGENLEGATTAENGGCAMPDTEAMFEKIKQTWVAVPNADAVAMSPAEKSSEGEGSTAGTEKQEEPPVPPPPSHEKEEIKLIVTQLESQLAKEERKKCFGSLLSCVCASLWMLMYDDAARRQLQHLGGVRILVAVATAKLREGGGDEAEPDPMSASGMGIDGKPLDNEVNTWAWAAGMGSPSFCIRAVVSSLWLAGWHSKQAFAIAYAAEASTVAAAEAMQLADAVMTKFVNIRSKDHKYQRKASAATIAAAAEAKKNKPKPPPPPPRYADTEVLLVKVGLAHVVMDVACRRTRRGGVVVPAFDAQLRLLCVRCAHQLLVHSVAVRAVPATRDLAIQLLGRALPMEVVKHRAYTKKKAAEERARNKAEDAEAEAAALRRDMRVEARRVVLPKAEKQMMLDESDDDKSDDEVDGNAGALAPREELLVDGDAEKQEGIGGDREGQCDEGEDGDGEREGSGEGDTGDGESEKGEMEDMDDTDDTTRRMRKASAYAMEQLLHKHRRENGMTGGERRSTTEVLEEKGVIEIAQQEAEAAAIMMIRALNRLQHPPLISAIRTWQKFTLRSAVHAAVMKDLQSIMTPPTIEVSLRMLLQRKDGEQGDRATADLDADVDGEDDDSGNAGKGGGADATQQESTESPLSNDSVRGKRQDVDNGLETIDTCWVVATLAELAVPRHGKRRVGRSGAMEVLLSQV
jgi:hypothetical protein